jgi:hypothetical protein
LQPRLPRGWDQLQRNPGGKLNRSLFCPPVVAHFVVA